jgi:hypothetical protein
MPESRDNNYIVLYKTNLTLNLTNTIEKTYLPSHDLEVAEAITKFKKRFQMNHYMLRIHAR